MIYHNKSTENSQHICATCSSSRNHLQTLEQLSSFSELLQHLARVFEEKCARELVGSGAPEPPSPPNLVSINPFPLRGQSLQPLINYTPNYTTTQCACAPKTPQCNQLLTRSVYPRRSARRRDTPCTQFLLKDVRIPLLPYLPMNLDGNRV